jgi:hypothetical protein
VLALCVLIAAVITRKRTGRRLPARVWILIALSAVIGVLTLLFMPVR